MKCPLTGCLFLHHYCQRCYRLRKGRMEYVMLDFGQFLKKAEIMSKISELYLISVSWNISNEV